MMNVIRKARKKSPMGLFEKEVTQIRVYPWDLDIFNELNNGRALTLYDMGRFSLSARTGLDKILMREKLGLTVAGSFIRYRRRIQAFQKIDISAQCIGIDDKFFYMLQNMHRNGEAVGQVLIRAGLTRNGLMSPKLLIDLMDVDIKDVPKLPQWAQNIANADNERPWPPKDDENEK